MKPRNLQKYLLPAAALLILWLGVRYILPLALPFLLAAALALISEPLVRVFQNRLHLRRSIASGIGVSISLLLTVLIMITLCAFLLKELGELAGILPDLEDTASIAGALGTRDANIRMTLSRLRKKLKHYLQQEGFDF